MSVAFAAEAFSKVWPEAQLLMQAHWAELAHYPDIPLDPNEATYAAAESLGILRVFTVRDAGDLVGYCAFHVCPAPHYKTSIQAHGDVIYLHPALRGRLVGLRFLKWCDAQLSDEGVQVVYHHVKLAHPQLGGVLNKMGYQPIDTIYGKRLDHGRS